MEKQTEEEMLVSFGFRDEDMSEIEIMPAIPVKVWTYLDAEEYLDRYGDRK